MANNFYNPSNPWMYNSASTGAMNNMSGQMNQNNLQAQTPGYAGFNNFMGRSGMPAPLYHI